MRGAYRCRRAERPAVFAHKITRMNPLSLSAGPLLDVNLMTCQTIAAATLVTPIPIHRQKTPESAGGRVSRQQREDLGLYGEPTIARPAESGCDCLFADSRSCTFARGDRTDRSVVRPEASPMLREKASV